MHSCTGSTDNLTTDVGFRRHNFGVPARTCDELQII
jgi:hypothetical protein